MVAVAGNSANACEGQWLVDLMARVIAELHATGMVGFFQPIERWRLLGITLLQQPKW